jgi:NAD-dependent deacetylase
MKPDVVLFGEVIPSQALFTGETLAKSCEVLLVIGTSAQVYPQPPYLTQQNNGEQLSLSSTQTELQLQNRYGHFY